MKFTTLWILISSVFGIRCKKMNNEELTDLILSLKEIVIDQQNTINELMTQFKAMNTTDLEERVDALELGLALVEDDVGDIETDLIIVEQEVDNLDVDVSIQEERILSVESDVDALETESTNQEERLDSVETTVLDQADQISNLEGAVTLLSNRVDVLEETDTTIQNDINDLGNVDGALASSISELNGTTIVLQVDLQNVNETNAEQQTAIDDLYFTENLQNQSLTDLHESLVQAETEIANLDADLNAFQSDLNVSNGFLAVISSAACTGGVLQFQTVRFNAGNGYSGATGVFTAQVAGLYHFMMFLRSSYTLDEDSFSISKNDDIQCTSRTEGAETGDVEIYATCAATVELVPGDEVYVSCPDTNAMSGNDYSGFTGFLTKPYL